MLFIVFTIVTHDVQFCDPPLRGKCDLGTGLNKSEVEKNPNPEKPHLEIGGSKDRSFPILGLHDPGPPTSVLLEKVMQPLHQITGLNVQNLPLHTNEAFLAPQPQPVMYTLLGNPYTFPQGSYSPVNT